MKQKQFEAQLDEMKRINKMCGQSIVSGTKPVRTWFEKKVHRLKMLGSLWSFRMRNPLLAYQLKKHPERFILRAFYRYFSINKMFMIRPRAWLMLLHTMPPFIAPNDANHVNMRINKSNTRKRKHQIAKFLEELYFYNTLENLWAVSRIKEAILKKRAEQLMEYIKLSGECETVELENSPSEESEQDDSSIRFLK